jgi:hypothetical protein
MSFHQVISRDEIPPQGRDRTLVLVKALPHVGQRHGETVCCAGITQRGERKRQYPIHFRRLDQQFKRWDWIEYDWVRPGPEERRAESRRVQEHTIFVRGNMPIAERARFLNQFVVPSTLIAAERGQSLALIRPRRSRFSWKAKSDKELAREKSAYERAAQQLSFLDKELAALKPCPFAFNFRYDTEDGKSHIATCDDWETSAMYYRWEKTMGSARALEAMSTTFNVEYPARGMIFAMGTHSRYPDVWLLVGVIRLDPVVQMSLPV